MAARFGAPRNLDRGPAYPSRRVAGASPAGGDASGGHSVASRVPLPEYRNEPTSCLDLLGGGRTDLMNAVNTACGRANGRRVVLGLPRGEGVAPCGLVVGRSFAMLARRHRTGHIPAAATKSKRSAHIFRAHTSARRATHCATTAYAREYFSREFFAARARKSPCAATFYARNKHVAMR